MNKQNILYVNNNKEWRSWLENNFEKEKEIWLVFPKKSSIKKRLLYNDAVEEALSFGWIDSKVKRLDDENIIQRFSPRNPYSKYSQASKERLKWLLKEKRLHPSVEPIAKEILKDDFIFPQDIIETIKEDDLAWKNYQNFSPSYKRIRIAYIDSTRKRPEEFKKRLANFIEKSRANKLIGYGGIEKYY
ncbi:MAG: hypothetical protein FJW68_10435 [Actinobacteria bacterium]|nr:hypothetical protein [Actinomycetota bacterium]